MGFIVGITKCLVRTFLYLTVFVAAIILIPNLPPYTKFTSIKHEPTQPRVGPLAPNDVLNNVEKLYVDKLEGPEAFQVYKGELYTSLATGEIVKLSPGGHVTFVTKIGRPCTGIVQEHICGRPLGFQIDEKNNLLYVADAYYGIWKVDLKTDKKHLLVSPQVEIDGQKPMLFNFVALDQKGNLYWTDSSADFHLKDGAISSLTDPSGRLFQYDAAKNKSKVLLDNLWFANGVEVSPDNQFVVVAETLRYRLMKYYVDGPKKGKSEVFVDGLPGTPDNLRALPDGSGVLVPLYSVFDDRHPLLLRSLSETPALRKFAARFMRLVEIPFEYLNQYYPHILFEEIIYRIGNFKSLSCLTPPTSGLVQVDWSGNIVASYYNTDGSMPHLSDAIVYNDKLYLGRPHVQNYVGVVPVPPLLKKAFSKSKEAPKAAEPKMEKKVVQEPKIAKPVEKVTPPTQAKPQPQKQAESKPTPKPVTLKPVETKPKPAETKPTTPKPAETKPTTPKPAETKPTTPKPAETKPTTPKPAETKPTTSKPAQPKPTTPKPAEAKVKPEQKPAATEKKQEQPKAQKADKSTPEKPVKSDPPKPNKPVPEHIPIKEEIPVDTVKPNKDTLKVIKKDGPAEIPNPHV